MYVHTNMGLLILSFPVGVLICRNLTDKSHCENSYWPYTQFSSVRQITYRTVVVHTILNTYANRASDVYQMAPVTVAIQLHYVMAQNCLPTNAFSITLFTLNPSLSVHLAGLRSCHRWESRSDRWCLTCAIWCNSDALFAQKISIVLVCTVTVRTATSYVYKTYGAQFKN